MTGVRFRATWRDRVEIVEVDGQQWSVGADPGSAVRLHHPSVRSEHLQVLLRRGRFIVCPTGAATVLVDDVPVRAPSVLAAGQVVRLGDVALNVDAPTAGPEPRLGGLGAAVRQLATSVGRRYALAAGGEAGWVPSGPAVPAWAARVADSAAGAPGLAAARGPEPSGPGYAWHEALPPGVRLRALLLRSERGDLSLPLQSGVVLIRQLAEAVGSLHTHFGPHGRLGPDAVHVDARGGVWVLRPPPQPTYDEQWSSPERRFGLPPSRPDDAFAFGSLAIRLLRATEAPPDGWTPFGGLLQSQPRRRSVDLQGAARALDRRAAQWGLDATASHLARPVRLLHTERETPLISVPSGRDSTV